MHQNRLIKKTSCISWQGDDLRLEIVEYDREMKNWGYSDDSLIGLFYGMNYGLRMG